MTVKSKHSLEKPQCPRGDPSSQQRMENKPTARCRHLPGFHRAHRLLLLRAVECSRGSGREAFPGGFSLILRSLSGLLLLFPPTPYVSVSLIAFPSHCPNAVPLSLPQMPPCPGRLPGVHESISYAAWVTAVWCNT